MSLNYFVFSSIKMVWTLSSMRTFSDGSIAESLGERGPDLALVVNGHSLVYALQPDLELLFLG